MIDISIWPILASGVLCVLLGMSWYHPKVFGTQWARMTHITPEEAERGKRRMYFHAVLGFLAAMLGAYVLARFGVMWGVFDTSDALTVGFLAWLGFTAVPMLGIVLWEGKPIRLYLINTIFWLIWFELTALILLF